MEHGRFHVGTISEGILSEYLNEPLGLTACLSSGVSGGPRVCIAMQGRLD